MGDVDVYQPFRMTWLWPMFGGLIGFSAVRLLALLTGPRLSRWQVIMAAVAGLMVGVVMISVARQWRGTATDWLLFTLGFGCAVLVLLANALVAIMAAGRGDDC